MASRPGPWTEEDFEATSTKACFDLRKYGEIGFANGIFSYVNNLPVKVDVYHRDRSWTALEYDGTIRPGGYSSDTSSVTWWGQYGAVCTGGATPSF
ncbi:hypothetical protein [Streptomyces sp. NPDC051921]|uniref:hypothetical protein n=1 Tax=Streptomyces sp. NPDC051921 TaxID=3155806 RepID=UPI00342BDF3B